MTVGRFIPAIGDVASGGRWSLPNVGGSKPHGMLRDSLPDASGCITLRTNIAGNGIRLLGNVGLRLDPPLDLQPQDRCRLLAYGSFATRR